MVLKGGGLFRKLTFPVVKMDIEVTYYNPKLDREEKAIFETVITANMFRDSIRKHDFLVLRD